MPSSACCQWTAPLLASPALAEHRVLRRRAWPRPRATVRRAIVRAAPCALAARLKQQGSRSVRCGGGKVASIAGQTRPAVV